jgi:hypothetical protein
MTDDERIEESAEEDAEQSETAAGEAQSGHEEPDAQPEFDAEAPPLDTDVFDMLRAAIGLFTQEAWIALGLQPRYGAGETEMDLRCAKVAIDTTQWLVEQLGDEAAEEEKRDFDRTLTDLRVNFMRRRKRAEEEAPEA